ncbi:MAG: ABC transporter ATP-binding protein [Acidobacteria bacterium]|nr:ABC transporter ATP-binding protein [Acidobacteriota bacterium]
MIKLDSVTKCYGELKALNEVSLSIGSEIFALLGANGAGKSTMLKLILGMIEPDSGIVLVKDKEVKFNYVQTRQAIGYLPENLVLYERLTGREFLQFVAGIKGLGREANQEIDQALTEFDLKAKQNLLIRQYSFGMKKRIGLIAAMLGKPEILILDEPLNGLDVETIATLRSKIEKLYKEGKTIIFSSHIMDFVERMATRVMILSKGQISVDGTISDLRKKANLPNNHFEEIFFYFAK